jgi:hypothetical protein
MRQMLDHNVHHEQALGPEAQRSAPELLNLLRTSVRHAVLQR